MLTYFITIAVLTACVLILSVYNGKIDRRMEENKGAMVCIPRGLYAIGIPYDTLLKDLANLKNIDYKLSASLVVNDDSMDVANGFYVDKFEVTNEVYSIFSGFMNWFGGDCKDLFAHPDAPKNKDYISKFNADGKFNKNDQPVVGVDWYDAYAFAKFMEMQLPNNIQWEYACRNCGTTNYPWGNKYNSKNANIDNDEYFFPVDIKNDKFESGCTSNGIHHFSGNVAEWTESFLIDGVRMAGIKGGGCYKKPGSIHSLCCVTDIAEATYKKDDIGIRLISYTNEPKMITEERFFEYFIEKLILFNRSLITSYPEAENRILEKLDNCRRCKMIRREFKKGLSRYEFYDCLDNLVQESPSNYFNDYPYVNYSDYLDCWNNRSVDGKEVLLDSIIETFSKYLKPDALINEIPFDNFIFNVSIRYENYVRCRKMTDSLRNGIKMRYVKRGRFIPGPPTDNRIIQAVKGSKKSETLPLLYENKPMEATTRGFFIDSTEVTNAEYAIFLKNKMAQMQCYAHPLQPRKKDYIPKYWHDTLYNQPNQPVVGVDWWDAFAFANWAGKRLPTKEEWEIAARHPKGIFFPWGDNFFPGYTCSLEGGFAFPSTVKSFPKDKCSNGLYDMAGNVSEWTASTTTEETNFAYIKGGNYLRPGAIYSILFVNSEANRNMRHYSVGFRCAMNR